jgi:hypothetical protein
MAHELAAAFKAARVALKADATLTALIGGSGSQRVYAMHVPQEVGQSGWVDYVLMQLGSPGRDTQVLDNRRTMTAPLIDVWFVTQGDPFSAAAQSAAKRIDVVLDALASVSVTDANNDTFSVSANREGGPNVLESIDPETKKRVYMVGGSYRFYVSAA